MDACCTFEDLVSEFVVLDDDEELEDAELDEGIVGKEES